jgi:hypothetical protein
MPVLVKPQCAPYERVKNEEKTMTTKDKDETRQDRHQHQKNMHRKDKDKDTFKYEKKEMNDPLLSLFFVSYLWSLSLYRSIALNLTLILTPNPNPNPYS